MKRSFLLVVMSAALAGAAHPAWGDSAVIATPAGVGTPIASLPYTITQPGFYYLQKNLSATGAGSAITITASEVTLDLMGSSLTGPGQGSGTAGISIPTGVKYVELRNGQIKNFYWGISAAGTGSNHRLINLKVSNCFMGIFVGAQNSSIIECQVMGNYRGIEGGSMGAVVDKNTAAFNTEYGFIVSGSKGIVTNNTATSNGYGFWLGASSGQLVDRNASYGNIHWNWNDLSGCTVGLNTP
jgi:parallel beta-helix repeat protein